MTKSRIEHRGATVRTRILAWTLTVVAVSLVIMVMVSGRALFARIETDAAIELEHEAEKLRAYADSVDPSTGRPFANAREVLNSYLSHNIAETDETFFSIVDGSADRRSIGEPPVRLDLDDDFVQMLSGTRTPFSNRIDTEAGPVLYAALPVRAGADTAVLVVLEFLGSAQRGAWTSVLIMSSAGLIALLLAGTAGWFVAGRALTPLRQVTETAARIGGGDLSERIPVTGDDDVAMLTGTFNRMLDRLQSAFEGQRRFLDDAGHELRTPITVIRGHLELMGSDPQEQEQTLRLVDDELHRMGRLVDDLVLLARSESPDFLMPAPVDLADLIVETLAKATALAERSWSLDAIPEGSITADAQRLTQALLQLAANAVAHTTTGQSIALGGEVHPDSVLLWVRDDGAGIPHDEQELIFDRLFRGSSTRRSPGGGLGLAIVKRIAQAHGGSVAVDSIPGHGARFTLTLPAGPAPTGRTNR